MPYPYAYEGSQYLPSGAFNSMLLGRTEYGGVVGGYGRGPFSYNSFFGASYPTTYSAVTSQYGPSKYLNPTLPLTNELGLKVNRLKGLSRLPSLKPNRLTVFHTENIDVTSPRMANPKEITRERLGGYDGTIRRGRTVIRMETEHLKDNPGLDNSVPKKKPKKTAGQKLKEKYLVGSVKKRKHGGYRRPTLNDLNRALQDQESLVSDQSDECSDQVTVESDQDDPYYKRNSEESVDKLILPQSFEEEDSLACDKEIELIFQKPQAAIVGRKSSQPPVPSPDKNEDEPEVVTITLKPKTFLPVLAEEDAGPELLRDFCSITDGIDALEINSERRPSATEYIFTVPLPRIQMEGTDVESEDLDGRFRWISYRREPENPDDFWARQSCNRQNVSNTNLELSIPCVSSPVQNASPEHIESTDGSDIWSNRSPTPNFYMRRSFKTILEKNETDDMTENGQEDEDEAVDNFDFWGMEKRPSYHCMRRGVQISPEHSEHGDEIANRSPKTPDEKSSFDFWSNEKRPSYHRFLTTRNSHRTYNRPLISLPSLSHSPTKSVPDSTIKFSSDSSIRGTESVSKKSNDSRFFEPSVICDDSAPRVKLRKYGLETIIKHDEVNCNSVEEASRKEVRKNEQKREQIFPINNVPEVVATTKDATTISTASSILGKNIHCNLTSEVELSKEAQTQNDNASVQDCSIKDTKLEGTPANVVCVEETANKTAEESKWEFKLLSSERTPETEVFTSIFEEIQTMTIFSSQGSSIHHSSLRNPRIESLKKAERNVSESSSGFVSEASTIDVESPNVTPKSSIKEGSTSTSSSTLSAGTSSASSRRMPSPPSDYDSEDESKGKLNLVANASESRTSCPSKGRPKYRTYHLNDFQFLKVLGKGSFGKVLLAELKGTDSYYAIKCLKKDVVLEDDDVECTMIERKVLLIGSKHPYLCHLFCTFQSESHLFFAMEYLNGGDLMFHIQHDGRFSEERARFYGAEIVSGLKFLHKKGVIYRDLKLDNILLDYEGHVRIADFGMCKLQIFLDRTADTFCGTPDYMSPEIIKGVRYNQCVDYWAFGVLLYEMLVGQSPFSGADEDELFWSICNEPVHFPRFLSRESKRILELLLEKDGYRRLGSPGSIYGDIKDIGFFVSIDWERLERRELEPPFKPKLRDPLDVKYFDTTFTKEVARLTPVDKQILRSMDQSQFDGFSYTNPHTTD